MKHKVTQKDSGSVGSKTNETILANWLCAVSTFYILYNQLGNFLNKKFILNGLSSTTCKDKAILPINRLCVLLNKMKHELKKLLEDMELSQAGNLSEEKYKQLIAHTRILNRLNQEAELLSLSITVGLSYKNTEGMK